MAIELSVQRDTLGVPSSLLDIERILSRLLGQDGQVRLTSEARGQDEVRLEVNGQVGSVQVLRFDVPSSPAGDAASHVNVSVADRTPLAVALMVATAIALAEREHRIIVDDSCLFGASGHDPSILLDRLATPADGLSVDAAARMLCTEWGLKAGRG